MDKSVEIVKNDNFDALRFLSTYQNIDIYLINKVSTDDEERQILDLLRNEKVLLDNGTGLYFNKILFCSTFVGQQAMVKQIEPAIHVDSKKSLGIDF
jgi:hypothetical protein